MDSRYNIKFILVKSQVEGFRDSIEIPNLPYNLGRKDFAFPVSHSMFIDLKQISREFFQIDENLIVRIHEKNKTHFKFLNDNDEIQIINGRLSQPLVNGMTLQVASYGIEDNEFRSKNFKEQTPVTYSIQIEDVEDRDDGSRDIIFDVEDDVVIKKSRKKEEPDLICPYCNKKFKQLSLHFRKCKQRPSDRIRPQPDEDGFIPKKKKWEIG